MEKQAASRKTDHRKGLCQRKSPDVYVFIHLARFGKASLKKKKHQTNNKGLCVARGLGEVTAELDYKCFARSVPGAVSE